MRDEAKVVLLRTSKYVTSIMLYVRVEAFASSLSIRLRCTRVENILNAIRIISHFYIHASPSQNISPHALPDD